MNAAYVLAEPVVHWFSKAREDCSICACRFWSEEKKDSLDIEGVADDMELPRGGLIGCCCCWLNDDVEDSSTSSKSL